MFRLVDRMLKLFAAL